MCISFISSTDIGETRTIYVWSNNESIMWCSDTDNVIRELFESFLNDYQKEKEILKGSNFVFELVELMDYKLHKVRLKRDRSYIESPECILYKRATINPKIKKDNKCFQESVKEKRKLGKKS